MLHELLAAREAFATNLVGKQQTLEERLGEKKTEIDLAPKHVEQGLKDLGAEVKNGLGNYKDRTDKRGPSRSRLSTACQIRGGF